MGDEGAAPRDEWVANCARRWLRFDATLTMASSETGHGRREKRERRASPVRNVMPTAGMEHGAA